MAQRRLKLNKTGDVYLPEVTVRRLLDCADGSATLVYLYLLSHDGEIDDHAAMLKLRMQEGELARALDLLARLGLTEAPAPLPERADTLPEYTPQDIADMLEQDPCFSDLLDYTQARLGKMLSTVDVQTLLGIYSWMGLPMDVICLLITSCVDETKKKYGEGRRPTMRSIEKRARLWLNLGLLTQEAAETYLKEQEARGTRMAKLARLLHLDGRALSPTEQRYLSEWQCLDDELILKAYDVTVVQTGGLKWKYMDKVLKNWSTQGVRTEREPEAIQQHELDSVRKLREINEKRGRG